MLRRVNTGEQRSETSVFLLNFAVEAKPLFVLHTSHPGLSSLVDYSAHSSSSMQLLTLHWQGDGLAGLVLPVLVINCLDVVAAGVRCHRWQDNQCVVQCDGAAGKRSRMTKWEKRQQKETIMRRRRSQGKVSGAQRDGNTFMCTFKISTFGESFLGRIIPM